MNTATRRIHFVAAATLLSFGSLVLGGDFFVDKDNGDDTNAGTRANPFQTIQKGVAAAAAQAGKDTIIILVKGNYNERVTISGHDVCIKKDDPKIAVTVIPEPAGSDPDGSGTWGVPGLDVDGGAKVTVEGLKIFGQLGGNANVLNKDGGRGGNGIHARGKGTKVTAESGTWAGGGNGGKPLGGTGKDGKGGTALDCGPGTECNGFNGFFKGGDGHRLPNVGMRSAGSLPAPGGPGISASGDAIVSYDRSTHIVGGIGGNEEQAPHIEVLDTAQVTPFPGSYACLSCPPEADNGSTCSTSSDCDGGACERVGIPTVSEWGLVWTALLTVTAGCLVLRARKAAPWFAK